MNLCLFVLLLSHIIFYGSLSSSEDLMWESMSNVTVKRREGIQAELFLCCRFRFQLFRFFFHTCLNLLPNAIKMDVACGKKGCFLIYKMIFTPFLFYHLWNSLIFLHSCLNHMKDFPALNYFSQSKGSWVKFIYTFKHFTALNETWQIAHFNSRKIILPLSIPEQI